MSSGGYSSNLDFNKFKETIIKGLPSSQTIELSQQQLKYLLDKAKKLMSQFKEGEIAEMISNEFLIKISGNDVFLYILAGGIWYSIFFMEYNFSTIVLSCESISIAELKNQMKPQTEVMYKEEYAFFNNEIKKLREEGNDDTRLETLILFNQIKFSITNIFFHENGSVSMLTNSDIDLLYH